MNYRLVSSLIYTVELEKKRKPYGETMCLNYTTKFILYRIKAVNANK